MVDFLFLTWIFFNKFLVIFFFGLLWNASKDLFGEFFGSFA